MPTPHYKQVRIQLFQDELGKYLCSINRASPTGTNPNGRKTYTPADLTFTQPAADTIKLSSYGLLLSKDVIIDKSKQDNGLILVTDLNELTFDSPQKFSGTVNGTPVTYDLRSEYLSLFEWFLYDENAKYCLRIVRRKNDGTDEHLFCGDFKRKDFKFTNVGITSAPKTSTETSRKKVTIKAAPLVQRMKDVIFSDVGWSDVDMVSSGYPIQCIGGLEFTQIGIGDDAKALFQLRLDFEAGKNPIFNNAGGSSTAQVKFLVQQGYNIANGETVTIDGKTYTFQTVLTNVDGNIKLETTFDANLANLLVAINLTSHSGGGAGVVYAAAMTKHPTVECDPSQLAWLYTYIGLVIKAQSRGSAGNSIAVSDTCVHADFSTPTLTGGTSTPALAQPGYAPFKYDIPGFNTGNGVFPASIYGISLYTIFNKLFTHADVGYTLLGYDSLPITFFNQKWNAGTGKFDIDEATGVNSITQLYQPFETLFGFNPNIGFIPTGATNATPIEITVGIDGVSAGQKLSELGIATGAKVRIDGVGGNTNANGVWSITVTAENKFTLTGSVGNGVFSYSSAARCTHFISTPITYEWDTPIFDFAKEYLYGTGLVSECSVNATGDPQVYLRDRRSLTGVSVPASFASHVVGDTQPTTEEDFIPPPVITAQYKGDNDKLYAVRKPLPEDTQINLTFPFRTHALADISGNVYGRHLVYNSDLPIVNQNAMRFEREGSTVLSNVPAGWFPGCLIYTLKNGTAADAILPAAAISDESVQNVNGDTLFAAAICQYKSDTAERISKQFAEGQNYLYTMLQFYCNALNLNPVRQVTRTYSKITDSSDNIAWLKPGVADSFFWDGAVRNWEAVRILIYLKKQSVAITSVEQPDYTTLTEYKIIPEGSGGTSGGSQGSNTSGGGSTGGGTTTPQTDALINDPNASTVNIIQPPSDVIELDFRDSSPAHTSVKFQSTNSTGTTIYAGLLAQSGFFTKVQNAFQVQPFGVSAGNTGEVRFLELAANGVNYVGFKSPDALAANVIFTLPSADGLSNYLLGTSGAKVLSFLSIAGLIDAGTGITISESGSHHAIVTCTVTGTVTSVNASGAHGITVSGVPFTASGTIAIDISTNGIALDRIAVASANSKLLGSGASGSGATYVELTLGTGLSMSGTTLNVSSASGANPTATIGLTAVNGSAATFLRSDGAPALSQSIVPTWTGLHTFNGAAIITAPASTIALVVNGASGVVIAQMYDSSSNNILTVDSSGFLLLGDSANYPSTRGVLNITQKDNSTVALVIKEASPAGFTMLRMVTHGDVTMLEADATGLVIGGGTPAARLDVRPGTLGIAAVEITTAALVKTTLFQNQVSVAGGAATLIHSFTTATGTVIKFRCHVVARVTAGAGVIGNGASFDIAFTYKNIAGVLTQIGADAITNKQSDDAAYTGASNINGTAVELKITGKPAHTLLWDVDFYASPV